MRKCLRVIATKRSSGSGYRQAASGRLVPYDGCLWITIPIAVIGWADDDDGGSFDDSGSGGWSCGKLGTVLRKTRDRALKILWAAMIPSVAAKPPFPPIRAHST